MLLEMTAVSILGGFLCLDRTCLQIMVSRPVVVAPLLGWVLGDVLTGLTIGAFLELLWVDKQQIGIYVPPNDSLLAIVIVTALLLAFPQLTERRQELTAFAFLALLPMSYLTKRMDTALIQANEALSDNGVLMVMTWIPRRGQSIELRSDGVAQNANADNHQMCVMGRSRDGRWHNISAALGQMQN